MPIDELKDLKVAIIHDWLVSYGGAERVVEVWADLFPKAPIYTTVYDEKNLGHTFPAERIRPSRMQGIPGVKKHYRKMLSLMPRAFEEFDLTGYDLILSSSSSCAKGVMTSAGSLHVSYVHSPMRYAWDLYAEYLREAHPIVRMGMRRQMPGIRQWDASTGLRVDKFLANSREVAARIENTYRREAAVLHPPVSTDFFTPDDSENPEDYYLILSRFIPYKRIDLAILACNQMNRRLIVIGDGPQKKELQKLAGPTIEFTGRIPDEEVVKYYQKCRGFLFPGFEDFGITPVETQACGRPVIAYGKGGALDSIIPDKTGIYFPEQTLESLMAAMEEFEGRKWDTSFIRKHAEGFSRPEFERKLQMFLTESLREKQEKKYRVL